LKHPDLLYSSTIASIPIYDKRFALDTAFCTRAIFWNLRLRNHIFTKLVRGVWKGER